jgi:hypothetical protein
VQARESGIQFPNYAYSWKDVHPAGMRADKLGDHHATTVVYRGASGDVGYTIVGGKPLAWPKGAQRVTAGGIDLAVHKRGDATVVTWRRDGHTCVLATRGGASVDRLVRYATWV